MNNIDWNLIRAFVAVAEQGSLSGAARVTGQSQPTMGRHIDALEEQVGSGLFDRSVAGLQLTAAGQDLLREARRMQDAADAFGRRASGQEQDLGGSVRISVNEIIGIEVMPRALAAFQRVYPEIQVEMVVSNQTTSLSRRDADLAVRMYRPEQQGLIARRLADLPLGFYAHKKYVAQYGLPETAEDFRRHRLIGFDRDLSFIDGAAQMGLVLTEKDFAFRCDSLLAQLAALRAGMGIAGSHCGLLDVEPDLLRVFKDVPLPPLEYWLVCHPDVAHNRRIRMTMDFLGEWMKADPYWGPDGPPEPVIVSG